MLTVDKLSVHFPLKTGQTVQALSEVSLTLRAGETLGVVGESGCGKSTLARAILHLPLPVVRGSIHWQGNMLDTGNKRAMQQFRRAVQCIFQDPLDALDPRMTVGDSIQEPLRALRPDMTAATRQTRVTGLLQAVGLEPELRNRYPHELSGGQCQRIGIARTLAAEPQLVVCDEPVSALDLSVQTQVVALLAELQRQHGLALLFISHDLGVVERLSRQVMVLYLGRVMEVADTVNLYNHPLHPYTRLLLDAIPLIDPLQERQRLGSFRTFAGDLPSPLAPPAGCVFHPRCPQAQPVCRSQIPVLQTAANRQVACHLVRL